MTDDDNTAINEDLKREARDWVIRLGSGSFNADDRAALDRWRSRSLTHRKAFAEASRLWGLATQSAREAVTEETAAPAPSRLHARGRLDRRAVLGGALAASAAGAAYVAIRPPLHWWPAITEFAADVRTDTGQQRNVVTGDGAAIEMNTQTSLNLPRSIDGTDRIELIAGEASITALAATARPVMVLAADGHAVTTDAQLNIRYDASDVRVTCLKGTVQVSCGQGTVTLGPRQQVSYGGGKLRPVAEIDPDVVTAWRQGLLVFRNDPLRQVVDEVNRYRSGKIVVMNEELGRQLVYANFRLDRLDEIVPRLAKVFGARVRSLPAGIIVLS